MLIEDAERSTQHLVISCCYDQ